MPIPADVRRYLLAVVDPSGSPIDLKGTAAGALKVDATFTGTLEVNLDLADDEVCVGNTSDGGTTRKLAKGDTSGRFVVTAESAAPVEVAASGGLPLPSGAATDGKQDTGNGSLSSIDGKITACDTSGLALETGGNLAAAAGSLSSIDGKITACDTSGLALETGGNLAAAAGSLSSIDGKITACDTSGLALETGGNLAAAAGSLSSIDGKITTCDTSGLALETGGNLAAAAGSLSSIDGKITACDTSGLALETGGNLATLAAVDFALESGGNLAACKTALEIIDDWDETNRCAVNPISGQAGVQGASGAVTALTQRVTLATDVALPSGTNLLGRVNPEPQAANGCPTASYIGAASDNPNVVKASAGNVYGIVAFNKNASPVYLKLYNKATAPTNGDTPIKRYMVPGNTNGAGFVIVHPMGVYCSAGIAFRLVAGMADNDNTSVSASEQLVNIDYK
jgi:hypothetical protein